ncbi:MAG: hypothetical protein CM15mP58_06930 [Burkholderiaceae bacterium]|nr:MAG: hypothetical protein CM15mP58_06930 [Burkholderiaceae bacterium]
MIQMQSRLNVADNSGAKDVCVLRFWEGQARYASIGDIIKVAIKEASLKGESKKERFIMPLVVRTSKGVRRMTGP